LERDLPEFGKPGRVCEGEGEKDIGISDWQKAGISHQSAVFITQKKLLNYYIVKLLNC